MLLRFLKHMRIQSRARRLRWPRTHNHVCPEGTSGLDGVGHGVAPELALSSASPRQPALSHRDNAFYLKPVATPPSSTVHQLVSSVTSFL